MENQRHFHVLIIGGGTGGLSCASRLSRALDPEKIAVIEPSETHFYQPLWTLVGAGAASAEETVRKTAKLIPEGVSWIRDSTESIDPALQIVKLASGTSVTYDYLIVAPGLRLRWDKIKGLSEEDLGSNGLCSIYGFESSQKTAQILNGFKGGHAIFTMPPVPIKCAGAPQKIMYLADEVFRRNGVRPAVKISYFTAAATIFGVPHFAKPLARVAQRKDISINYSHELVEVRPHEKVAVFRQVGDAGSAQTEVGYDLLHVVPPMSAPDFVANSAISHRTGPLSGWMNVDKQTLQSPDYKNIFGIGDITGVPNSKTGAAIRKQAPVVVENLLAVREGRPLERFYDGYSSCPLVTGFGKVILAEFGYDGKLLPTFPMDMTVERRSMWHLKKDLLPLIYWKGLLRGWL